MKSRLPLYTALGFIGATAIYFAMAATVDIAKFPGPIQISGVTDQLSVASHQFRINGSPLTNGGGGGGSAPVGTVVTNGTTVTAGKLLAFQTGLTNVGDATSAQIQGTLGAIYQATNGTLTALTVSGTNGFAGQIGAQATNTFLTTLVTAGTNGLLGQIGGQPTNSTLTTLTASGTNGFLGQIGGQPTNVNLTTYAGIPTNGLAGAIGAQATNVNLTAYAGIATNGLLGAIGGLNTNYTASIILPLYPNAINPTGGGSVAYTDTSASDSKNVFGTNYTARYQFLMPDNYKSGLKFKIFGNMETGTSATHTLQASIWDIGSGTSVSMGVESFDTANIVTTTTPGTARWPFLVSITCTNSDSVSASDWFMVELKCTATSGFYNMSGWTMSYTTK